MRTMFAAAVGLAIVAGLALAKQPPPVILDLGPLVPTPAPSPGRAERVRLITSFTVQNRVDGPSVIAFEATDLAKTRKKEFRIIAAELYNLAEPEPEARDIADRILRKIRDLESDLLEFAERTGPPRERPPLWQQEAPERPYR